MATSKVEEARMAVAMWGPDPFRRTNTSQSMATFQRELDALIAAVRADEREKAVARVYAVPVEETFASDVFSRGILTAVEAIRNV